MKAALLQVHGLVQGVGFRPLVYRHASDMGLRGWVQNTHWGVQIALAPADAAEALIAKLHGSLPRLARIEKIMVNPAEDDIPAAEDLPDTFEIRASLSGVASTGVVPDASICLECEMELTDPGDRRFHYPFLNCTQCGPRFSITKAVPYDRPQTSMAAFTMCEECTAEYSDVDNRRHHAQPNACPVCGPSIWLEDKSGTVDGDPMESAIQVLKSGGVLALRGLGGFHLACLATDQSAVETLRRRKMRPTKPLAVMVRDVNTARQFAEVSEAAEAEMRSPAAPIVLMPLKPGTNLAPSVVCGLGDLGVMLPYTPLHRLLLDAFEVPLVMTSGNIGGAPQITDNKQAKRDLGGIADAFLLHNRDIVNRIDDSVLQMTSQGPQVLRRARGLAPAPIFLPPDFEDHPPAVAFGADLKNTFALAKNGTCYLSQHIGDLSDYRTEQDLMSNIDLLSRMFGCEPEIVVTDAHSNYRSRKLAQGFADQFQIPLYLVNHHHAHCAAVMVEHGLPAGSQVLGLVQDGIGAGPEGQLWGGELLECSYGSAGRLATLTPAPLPGGDAAAREPWRNLAVRLSMAYGAADTWPAYFRNILDPHPVEQVLAAGNAGVNAPPASSTGRLFDAVAAALSLAPVKQSFEGEAAMMLQTAAEKWMTEQGRPDPYGFSTTRGKTTEIDPSPIWSELLKDVEQGQTGLAAARFHEGWAKAWSDIITAEGTPERLALSGGVFQNKLLAALLSKNLENSGCTVLQHELIPPNDGGITLGQIAIGLTLHRATT